LAGKQHTVIIAVLYFLILSQKGHLPRKPIGL
jgi:hypothetical protein